jgi:hypothetical protein
MRWVCSSFISTKPSWKINSTQVSIYLSKFSSLRLSLVYSSFRCDPSPTLTYPIRYPSTCTCFVYTRDDPNSSATHVCPTKDTHGPAIEPFLGALTYHKFSIILAGACAVVSTLMICVLVATHAFNYSNRVQQRQVIRIALLIPYVSFFSFLIVWLDGAGEYLVESLDFGCAIALSAFLLLMCDFVLSHPGGFDDLFGAGAESRGAFNGHSPTHIRVCSQCPSSSPR